MGCDIHMYIEYKRKNKEGNWNNFGGRINPGRNYLMFGLLAKGVRSHLENGLEPKGLPSYETLGWRTSDDATLYVSETPTDAEGSTSREQAENWVEKGYVNYITERKTCISHPDWHSYTWLTVDEFESQLKQYAEHENGKNYPEPEYKAVLAAMKSLQEEGLEVRAVFWFDN